MMTLKYKLLLGLLAAGASAQAFAPHNFFSPYDTNLRQADAPQNPFRFGMNFEYGSDNEGRNWDSNTANILKLYEASQSIIPSLINPQSTAARAEYLGLMGAGLGVALDDGVRGHVSLTGDFSMLDATVHGRYELPIEQIPGKLSISLALPVRHAEVKNVRFQDLTRGIGAADARVQARLTTDLATLESKVVSFGGAKLDAVSSTGLGDLVFMLDWNQNYEQDKEALKNVQLLAKAGVIIPTGKERDLKHAFSVPLGNDGAWGMPFGLGLNLDFNYYIRLGAEAQFEVLFDDTKERYMKTHEAQTAFLLINKGRATMDHGLTWQFNLFLQGYQFYKGLSLKAGYEYFKHDDDRLTPHAENFSAAIVNSARWLQESNCHNLIFQAHWDSFACGEWPINPQLSLFYKLPVGGKAIMALQTFGGQLSFSF